MKKLTKKGLSHIFLIVAVTSCIALGQLSMELYCQKKHDGIVALSNSMFFIDSILLSADEEIWENAISVLELQSSLIDVSDSFDNKKICDLVDAIIRVPSSSDNRKEIVEELNNLTISWDTRKWHWSCEIIRGDVDRIIKLCQKQ